MGAAEKDAFAETLAAAASGIIGAFVLTGTGCGGGVNLGITTVTHKTSVTMHAAMTMIDLRSMKLLTAKSANDLVFHFPLSVFRVGNRIVSAFSPRMAAADAFQRQPRASRDSVRLQ